MQNYKALDRALSPPSLFGDEPSEIPWVIVDGAWARPDTPMLGQLRALGVKIIVDTQGWRFSDERTWSVKKYATLGHRPEAPLDVDAVDAYVSYVRAEIDWQRRLGASALLIPGIMPSRGDDSAMRGLELALEVALTADSVDNLPLIGFVGSHSQDLGDAGRSASSISPLLAAVYFQITPVDPLTDSVSKLTQVGRALFSFEDAGTPVIAGHLGAMGGVLRSLGVTAADAGLGSSETFDAKRLLRPPKRTDGDGSGGPTGSRRYVAQILRSVSRRQWDAMMEVDTIRGFVDCRLSCCRFRTPDTRVERAREHSLRSRVAEAADLAGLPAGMRAGKQLDVMRAARASIATVNSALDATGHDALPTEHVENQLAALERLVATRQAA